MPALLPNPSWGEVEMPSIQPLKQDVLIVAVGPGQSYTLDKPSLKALVARDATTPPGRIPLVRVRTGEVGDVTLSKSGRSIIVRVSETGYAERSLIASAREARAFVDGTIPSLLLHDAREESAASDAMVEERRQRIADASTRLHEAARAAQARFASRPPR